MDKKDQPASRLKGNENMTRRENTINGLVLAAKLAETLNMSDSSFEDSYADQADPELAKLAGTTTCEVFKIAGRIANALDLTWGECYAILKDHGVNEDIAQCVADYLDIEKRSAC